ncbi:MAG: hypothetical protein SFU57_00425 [Gemmatimonadales bacterium]|nr:hypothetical protein [Gemmatimonadales bacterium]
MRVTVVSIIFGLIASGCRPSSAPEHITPVPEVAATDAFAVLAKADQIAARDLWPGFDPRTIPVAIYDGERTLLFRHPSPPEGFQPVPGRDAVYAYTGRYPSVTANSSAELGGVQTATLMPPTSVGSLRAFAGILIHEAFHVYQREHHPGWTANEVELFTYPVDDPELLALRRSETEALRRAIALRDADRAACWTRTALELRRKRFGALPSGSAAYERYTELNEGLATYVERRATGEPDSTVLGMEEFAPEAIRLRAYRSGVAIARLLDRFSPAWRTALEQSDSLPLDIMLSAALATPASGAPGCALLATDLKRIQAASAMDIGTLRARRIESKRAFLEQPGWNLVIVAAGAPLFPQGFDPLNLQSVSGGEVLHTRFVKVGNDSGAIEVLGRAALTEAAGVHPLFNGVRTLTVTGLAGEPVITDANGVVTVAAEGVTAELRGSTVERTGQTVTVRMPSRR